MSKFLLKGDKEFLKRIKSLEPKIAKKVAKKALRAGAKIIAAQVKLNAPVGETGQLRDAIKVKAGPRSKNFIAMSVTIGEKNFTGKAFYGAFVSLGTSKMPPNTFVEDATAAKATEAQAAIREVMKTELDKL